VELKRNIRWDGVRWSEELFEWPSFEQIELEEAKNLVHRPTRLAQGLEVSEKQIDDESDPDLAEDSVEGGAEKSFDFQVLLDPFEEQFDLPSISVDISDGRGGKIKGVGKKKILFPCLRISVADTA